MSRSEQVPPGIRVRSKAKGARRAGSPCLSSGSQSQAQEQPLLKALREHDVLLVKLAAPLAKAHAGPEPAAVVKPFRLKQITRAKAAPNASALPPS
jgi:hypothetical protein